MLPKGGDIPSACSISVGISITGPSKAVFSFRGVVPLPGLPHTDPSGKSSLPFPIQQHRREDFEDTEEGGATDGRSLPGSEAQMHLPLGSELH